MKLRVIAVFLALSQLPAFGQTTTGVADEAGVLFQLGAEAYQRRNWREALAYFFASNRLAPNRNVRFNIARCFEQLQQYVEACRYYLSSLSPEMSENSRNEVERSVDRLRPYVAMVRIVTDPPGATVYVERKELGSLGQTPLLLPLAPGSYRILLSKTGYHDQVEEVTAKLGREDVLETTLVLAGGWLDIRGEPEGATVQVEDVTGPVVGTVPSRLLVSAGTHHVVITKDGWVPTEQTATVATDRTTVLDVALKPVGGTLLVQSSEREALVLLDDRPVGFTPAVVEGVAAGRHRLEVQSPGFRPFVRIVDIRAGERFMVEADLALDEDVEAASRQAESIRDAPASVSLVGRAELEAFGYPNVSEALRGQRGAYLSDDGVYPALGLRGFTPFGQYNNRVLLQLDGHTLNDDWLGSSYIHYDLLSDLWMIDRIELVRGPGSVLHGTGAFFGVVNLVTPTRVPEWRVMGSAGAVDRGTGRASAEVTYPIGEDGDVWVSGGGVYGQPQEYFSPARLGSPEAPDGTARGVGAFRARTTLGKVWWRDLTLEWYYHARDKQIPTGAFGTVFGDKRTRTSDGRAFVEFRYEPTFARIVRLLARVWYDHYDYEGQYAYPDPVVGLTTESHVGDWAGVETRVAVLPGFGFRLTAGGGYENRFREHSKGEDRSGHAPYLDEGHEGQQAFAYGSVDWGHFPWMSASAGVRFDGRWVVGLVRSDGSRNDRFVYSVNPRAALIFHPVREGTLKLMGGRAFRAPSVYELTYWDGGVTQVRSPDLDPESVWSGEVEYSHRLPLGFSVLASGFFSRVTNLIEQVGGGTPDDPFKLVNGSRVLWTAGAEAEVRREFRGGWLVAAQYSFQRSRLGGFEDGTELPNSPEHMAGLKVVAPVAGRALRVATRAAFETGRLDRTGERTNRSLVWDVALSGEVRQAHLKYVLGARNLLDWKYEHPVGEEVLDTRIVQPGRQFFAEVSFWY